MSQIFMVPGTYDENLAHVETGDVASRNYAEGEFLTWKGVLHSAKTAISMGETFVEDTNVQDESDGGLAEALNKFNGYTLKEFLIPNSVNGTLDVGSTDCFLDGRSYHVQANTAGTRLPLNFYNGEGRNWAYTNGRYLYYGLGYGSSMIHAFIWVKEST